LSKLGTRKACKALEVCGSTSESLVLPHLGSLVAPFCIFILIGLHLISVLYSFSYFFHQSSQAPWVDNFIKDIKEYSAMVSGRPFPVGIILFGVSL